MEADLPSLDQLRNNAAECIRLAEAAHTSPFPSAADFLASPRLAETACLIVDVNMPAMTGVELYRRLIDAGHAIPTILVTAYPNDADRARALDDGVVCYLRKPVNEQRLIQCLQAALTSGEPPEENS
jgi:FixJ family two-component response regulator